MPAAARSRQWSLKMAFPPPGRCRSFYTERRPKLRRTVPGAGARQQTFVFMQVFGSRFRLSSKKGCRRPIVLRRLRAGKDEALENPAIPHPKNHRSLAVAAQ
jgi:hypothetical protein